MAEAPDVPAARSLADTRTVVAPPPDLHWRSPQPIHTKVIPLIGATWAAYSKLLCAKRALFRTGFYQKHPARRSEPHIFST